MSSWRNDGFELRSDRPCCCFCCWGSLLSGRAGLMSERRPAGGNPHARKASGSGRPRAESCRETGRPMAANRKVRRGEKNKSAK